MREKITVLIADDNQEFSTTLATYLKNQEDMVVVGRAKDGNEALDMVSSLMPDVLLLDVIMPHLDGIGVLEQMNMIKLNKKPICIMLSAVGQDKVTQRAIELGAEYYFLLYLQPLIARFHLLVHILKLLDNFLIMVPLTFLNLLIEFFYHLLFYFELTYYIVFLCLMLLIFFVFHLIFLLLLNLFQKQIHLLDQLIQVFSYI
jgi:CheY-like chemotaxis protein